MQVNPTDALERAYETTTCRDRQRQILEFVEIRGAVDVDELIATVARTACPVGHDLHFASLMGGLLTADDAGQVTLAKRGADWLLEDNASSPNWHRTIAPGTPRLRDWQAEALEAWCDHGRQGVIEAVTGTGKSRVGVEAIREALAHDHHVVVVVPTVDLVDQWVRTLTAHHISGVGRLGDGRRASLATHRVVVGTVQSLYALPPTRADGKILLVADECHRYGAGQWRRILQRGNRRRLGLTATFERNDDGINELMSYFGGGPVFSIDFPRAISDGVVAHYDVKLLGIELASAERATYDEADRVARDARLQLLSADFPAEPFGAFLHEVQRAAADDDDPTISDVARRYLKAFSERIDIMTNAQEKLLVAAELATRVKGSGGAIVFTRRVDMAEEIAAALNEAGAETLPIHSDLTRNERRDRLARLKSGDVKALVAPTILDEGIDVPDVDLGIVMGGSRSRRQMIQRMGRVLRLKPDGRKATFVVVFAKRTAEDLTQTDGAEGCLDLILRSADTVEPLSRIAASSDIAPVVAAVPPTPVPPSRQERPEPPQQHSPPVPTHRAAPSTQRPAQSSEVSRKKTPGTMRELLAKQPSMLLDLVDPYTCVVDMVVVTNAARSFDLGDPMDEKTLELTRALFASDLDERPDVTLVFGRFTVHGKRAQWTLQGDGRVIAISPKRARRTRAAPAAATSPSPPELPIPVAEATTASVPTPTPAAAPAPEAAPAQELPSPPAPEASPALIPSAPPRPVFGGAANDLVAQIERLAELKVKGLLTDEEFAAAKARLLRRPRLQRLHGAIGLAGLLSASNVGGLSHDRNTAD